jgi:hypothetical protein
MVQLRIPRDLHHQSTAQLVENYDLRRDTMQPIRLIGWVFLLTAILGFSIPAAAQNSIDGTSITPQSGSGAKLINSAGTWTFSSSKGSGGNVVLLNGSSSNGATGISMTVGNGGNLYVMDNESPGHWYEWNNGTWIHLYAVSPFPISGNGAVLIPGGQTDLVTSDGIWALGNTVGAGGNFVYLNGAQADSGEALELVISGGNLYTNTVSGKWYEWLGSSFSSPISNPNGGIYAACATAAVVGLNWSAVSGATTYNITRGGTSIETGTPLLYFNDQTVAPSTAYSYVLTAKNGSTTVSTQDLSVITSAASPDSDASYCPSTLIAGMTWNWSTGFNQQNNADLWDTTWGGSDGGTYLFFGDGAGFWGTNGPNDEYKASFGIAEITLGPPAAGSTPNFTTSNAVNIYGLYDAPHTPTINGKLNGIVAIGNNFYGTGNIYESGDTGGPSGAPEHTEIVYSTGNAYSWVDNGTKWQFCNATMGDMSLCATGFVNFGKGVGTAPDGYVYLLGSTQANFNTGKNGGCNCVYMMRVLPANILTYADYQIFAGYNSNGTPNFVTNGWSQMQPIWADPQERLISLGKVVYNAGLGRYIGVAQGFVNMDAFYDAPNPWGPWTTFAFYGDNPSNNTGGWGNLGTSSFGSGQTGGALGINFLNAWTSSNGLTMWATFSSGGNGASGAYPVGLSNASMDSFSIVSTTLTTY